MPISFYKEGTPENNNIEEISNYVNKGRPGECLTKTKINIKKKDDSIEEKEVLAAFPHFTIKKEPPYTEEDINEMLEIIKKEHILCTTPACYSVTGSGGTACGSCC